jgi:hypothetical protein
MFLFVSPLCFFFLTSPFGLIIACNWNLQYIILFYSYVVVRYSLRAKQSRLCKYIQHSSQYIYEYKFAQETKRAEEEQKTRAKKQK